MQLLLASEVVSEYHMNAEKDYFFVNFIKQICWELTTEKKLNYHPKCVNFTL